LKQHIEKNDEITLNDDTDSLGDEGGQSKKNRKEE